ncbi:MAG: SRPBCC family protein [Candidatus Acidiferrales bacterium]
MSEKINPATPGNTPTRRQMIAGVAIAFGGLAAGSKLWGETPQQTMKEAPSTAANQARTFLHQEVDFKASPQRIYEIFLDSKQFAACTGMPATIDATAGGAFSTFGGLIEGRNIELIPNQRIVQAWRPTHWDPGVYSIVRFELKPKGSETTVVLDHTGFPEGEFDHLDPGWKLRYWDPLKQFLA